MVGFIKKLWGGDKKSKSMAKSRLHFVLVQDRAGLSNEEMRDFKQELVSVIEKYFVIDKEGFDIAYQREQDSTTLLINSPVVVKRQQGHKGNVGKKLSKKKRKAAKQQEAANAAPAT